MARPNLSPTARIAIVNRGEAAVRFIRAVKEYNALYATHLVAVAFYVPADEDSPFVRQADEALALSGISPGERAPYLNRQLLLQALDQARCTAAWAGWGFLSEDTAFVEMLEATGRVFLGPSAAAMALLGDKIAAKELAESAGVPVVPWSRTPVGSAGEAREVVEKLGLPCIVKAAGTGGGRAIRPVRSFEELDGAFASAREESLRVAGNDRLFIERLVVRGRHLEVQILADRFGTVQSFGVRDCSLQRRNQKIIEETPPPGLDDGLLEAIEGSATALARAAGYESAGTVEFLYESPGKDRGGAGGGGGGGGDDGATSQHGFYFMEVNTRLQVEHPITEQAYGVDLVQGQIQVALGGRISDEPPRRQGVAVEARLNAEDPERGFSPAPGRVDRLSMPSGPGIRVDSGVEQGSDIPPEFDSMIAKIIAFAPNRLMALARLQRALREMRLKIRGGTSNRAFLIELLRQPEVQAGGVHTGYVEELLGRGTDLISRSRWAVALGAAAIEQYLKSSREELANFQQQLMAGGYPRSITVSSGLEVGLKARGRHHRFLVQAVGIHRYHVKSGDALQAVSYLPREQEALFMAGDARHVIQSVERGDRLLIEVDGIPYQVELDTGGTIRAPSPGLVLSLPVREAQGVGKGEVLVVLEAMKMEMVVAAPETGTVRELRVRPGEQVAAGQALLVMESAEPPAGKDAAPEPLGVGECPAPGGPPERTGDEQWSVLEQEYQAHFLGYDHDQPGQAALQKMLGLAAEHPELQVRFSAQIAAAVEAYADIERLFAGAPVSPEELTRPASFQELLSHYFRRQAEREKGLPEAFVSSLRRALRWYLPERATDDERTAALLRVYKSHAEAEGKQELLRASLFALQRFPLPAGQQRVVADRLDEVAFLSQLQNPSLSDAAINARYQLIDRQVLESWKKEKQEKVGKILALLARHRDEARIYGRLVDTLVNTGHHVSGDLIDTVLRGSPAESELALEILGRRFTRDRSFVRGEVVEAGGQAVYRVRAGTIAPGGAGAAGRGGSRSRRARGRRPAEPAETVETLVAAVAPEGFAALLAGLAALCGSAATPPEVVLLVPGQPGDQEQEQTLSQALADNPLPARWAALGFLRPDGRERFATFAPDAEGRWREDPNRRGINPRSYRELRLRRLVHFDQELLYASESVYLLHLQARENPRDERLVALVEVPSSRVQRDEQGRIQRMVALESVFMEAVYAMRAEQGRRKHRLMWNRIVIHLNTVLNTTLEQNREYAARLAARTADLGLEKIVVYSRRPAARGPAASSDPPGPLTEEVELLFENISGSSFTLRGRAPSEEPLLPMDAYVAKVVRARQRGALYPYEILKMITRVGVPVRQPFPRGEFEEFDIEVDEATGAQRTVSVKGRAAGRNAANLIFGLITHYPPFLPEGLRRVLVLSDPTADMGSLAEGECRRLIAALELAEERGLPVEWLPVSAGARIDMDSGTENLDWTARALRRIVEFTQRGGEINVIVAGINIGAQSYWNAEATMLMHTRGILIMTEEAAMLLTGKKALDFSGSVSAEDNLGIGGVQRIMGPNGQAQLRAKDLYEAYMALLRHYELTCRSPGARFPARAASEDPLDRDVAAEAYQDPLGQGFATIGDIFSGQANPERKKPFDMRQVMKALVDRDGPVLERWGEMKDAENAITWEARLGGFPVGLIGIESRPLVRLGEIPHDGPESWTGGTLFPLSSKKIARAINAFSARLPLVILANLSGFDGSPESLRKLQLEYGAEIGRAVVNFQGPILFVVTARYHGGAYVVFSKALNPALSAVALEGAYASVIGGAPAAAVVFPSEVHKRANADPRVVEARRRLTDGRAFYQKDYDELFQKVYAEKQAELARHFDQVHSVERAKAVGSIDEIVSLHTLRPYLIRRLEEAADATEGPASVS